MIASIAGIFFFLLYLGAFVFVIWLVVTALNRIGKGVEDISETLRRIESKGSNAGPSV
jgi:hypothetical protein